MTRALDLDGRVLRARVRRIRELLATVPALGRIDPPRLVDEPVTALAAERLLTVLVELAFACNRDVAVEVLGRAPASYPASFDLAAQAGLISAELVTTEMVLFEWLRDATHARFREVQALIR